MTAQALILRSPLPAHEAVRSAPSWFRCTSSHPRLNGSPIPRDSSRQAAHVASAPPMAQLGPHLGRTWAATHAKRCKSSRDNARCRGGRDPKPCTANRPRALRSQGRSESDRNGPNRFRKPVLYPLSYEGGRRLCRAEGSERGPLARARMLPRMWPSGVATRGRISMYD